MADVLAAFDALARHPAFDLDAIGVVGRSYGGYLAVLLTRERAVRWLALRVPALYKDDHWTAAKAEIDRTELERFRSEVVTPERNRALAACAKFRGDVLVVESERDDFVPHAVIISASPSIIQSRSLIARSIRSACVEFCLWLRKRKLYCVRRMTVTISSLPNPIPLAEIRS
jgi:hypothetical protein